MSRESWKLVDWANGVDAPFNEEDWDGFDEVEVSILARETLRDNGLKYE